MAAQDALSPRLWELGKAIADLVKKAREEGRVTEVKNIHVKRKFTEFEFKDGSIPKMGWTYENLERTEWSWKDLSGFLEEIKTIPGYSIVRDSLAKAYSVPQAQAEFWISSFAQAVSRSTVSGLTEAELVHLVALLVSDVEGSPKVWTITAWLTGIWTCDTKIDLRDSITLRQPKPSDFEMEQPARVESPFMNGFLGFNTPSAILEVVQRAPNQPEIAFQLETFYLILRLFRVGAVAPLRSYWNSNSLLSFGSFSMGPSNMNFPGEKYSLSASDVGTFSEFEARIKPLIPQDLIRGGEKTDYIVTSLQRFNDSVLKVEPPESRISFSIMSLEALYLKSGEREELAHRMSQRIAKTLSLFGLDPMEVYNTVRRTYEVRSKFVHGEPFDKADHDFAIESLSIILEWVRKSLVISLQMREKTTKEQFLNLVDNALLSPAADRKLAERVHEACTVV